MLKLLKSFWHDERGYVLVTEWMLVATILTLGSLAAIWSLHHHYERADDNPPAMMQSGLGPK